MLNQENASFADNMTRKEYPDILPDKQYSAMFTFVAFGLVAFGIVANALFIVALWKEKRLRTISNYLIAHLCVVDLLNCLVSVPTMLVMSNFPFTITACWYMFVFHPVGYAMSMYAQLLVAVNRYYLVTAPAPQYEQTFSRSKTIIAVVAGWVFHVIVSCLMMLVLRRPTHTAKYICRRFISLIESMLMNFIYLDGISILYFSICLVFYVKLGSYVRRNSMGLTAAKQRDSKLSTALLQILVLSIVSTLLSPMITLAFMLIGADNSPVSLLFEEIGLLLFILSYCVNPLFYGYKIDLFKEALKKMTPWYRNKTTPLQTSTDASESTSYRQGTAAADVNSGTVNKYISQCLSSTGNYNG